MPNWDIARDPLTCRLRRCLIGQGEAFRVGRTGPICEDCSIALDDEAAPAVVTPRPFVDRMHDAIAQAPPKTAAPGPAIRPGSQPTIHQYSLNRRSQRHGVVEAIRATTDTDWVKRASGDRD